MIVFMVEELSMYVTLQELLPKVFPTWKEKVDWLCLTHEGKSDLRRSIKSKLSCWGFSEDRFLILHDNDGGDCIDLKKTLRSICVKARKPDTLIRIPCQELESWFLGDLDAVADAFCKPKIRNLQKKKRYRDPDLISNASDDLAKLTSMRGKVKRARMIAAEMDINSNRSHSFNVFIEGLRNFK